MEARIASWNPQHQGRPGQLEKNLRVGWERRELGIKRCVGAVYKSWR